MTGAMTLRRSSRGNRQSARQPSSRTGNISPLARIGWISVIVAASAFALRQILLLAYTLGIVKW